MKEVQSNNLNTFTRRDLLIAGSAAIGGGMLLASGCHHPQEGLLTQGAWCKAHPNNVFCANDLEPYKTKPPRKDYDGDQAYGLFAAWLMMSTEGWDCAQTNCLKDPLWRRLAAADLEMYPPHLDTLYTTIMQSYAGSFQTLRSQWQDFRHKQLEPLGFPSYYPGGGPLFQLGWNFPDNPKAAFLPEKCGGAQASADVSVKTAWPISLWLMLTQNKFWLTNWLSNASIIGQIWDAFNVAATHRGAAQNLLTWAASNDGSRALSDAQLCWDGFLAAIGEKVYGGKPCSAPPTLIQIAWGGVKQ